MKFTFQSCTFMIDKHFIILYEAASLILTIQFTYCSYTYSNIVHMLFLYVSLTIYFMSTCRGYMAPEYVVLGNLTEKADVYSFGVLAIEIVSGKSCRSFVQNSCSILHTVTLLPFGIYCY